MVPGDTLHTDLGFVHRFQPGEPGPGPLMLALHGTGGDERDLMPFARRLAPGAPVLAPRGNVVEDDGVARFFRRIPVEPSSGLAPQAYPYTFDQREVAARATELAAFVEVARARYRATDRPVVALGFSNGANIAAALLLLRPGLFRAAILFAPMLVLRDPPRADLSDTAVFLGGGRADPVATPARVEELAAALTDAGAAVEALVADGGHELRIPLLRGAMEWFGKLRAAIAVDAGGLP